FQTKQGKVEVWKDMRSKEYNDVFVVGDCALVTNHMTGKACPPTAQIAIQQAKTVAQNIKKLVQGDSQLNHFQPNLLGTVVSLGFDDAMGTVMNDHKLYGWKATFMKKMIDNRYLLKLGGL